MLRPVHAWSAGTQQKVDEEAHQNFEQQSVAVAHFAEFPMRPVS